MPRTTLDIEAPILKEIKALQRQQGRSLGQVVSQLLAEALSRRRASGKAATLHWTSRSMRARVDIADKDALLAALDRDRT
jgi:hypothetical protein